jgi:hypothetical protein
MSFTKTAEQLVADFGARAARYDAIVLHNRCVANVLETIVAICMVVLGSSSVVGIFSAINALGEGGNVGAAVWAFVPTLINIIMAAIMAYLKVMQPREKQAAYGAASSACATVATVSKVVSRADLGDEQDKTDLLSNLLSSTLTALEAAAIDDQPPLPNEKKRK